MKSFHPFSSPISAYLAWKVIRRFSIPLILLAVVLLAYGWQISRLGFYWDDWVFVYRYQTMGILNTIFYGGTRQLGVFALMPGFLFAGDSVLLWHVYSLILRWVVVLIFWWSLNRLWPGQKIPVTLMAALFAVHPAFSQQSISVVYSLQFVDYAIFLISFGAMVSAVRSSSQSPNLKSGRAWLWLVIALLTQTTHLFIVEYFVGLELIRPVALYLLQNEKNYWQRFRKTFISWLPFLIILITYAVWRSGFFGGGFDTYEYKTITAFWHVDPNGALKEVIEYGLKDILVLLVNTWHGTLSPSIIDISQPYNFFSLVIAVLSTAGVYFSVKNLEASAIDGGGKSSSQELSQFQELSDRRFLIQAGVLGLFSSIVSFIPSWFVRRHIVEPGNFGDRFALAGLFGASILLVVFTQFFSARRGRGILFAAMFVGLAIGAQIRFANDYRWDWERQLRTYWQVFWRAPALKEGTTLVGFDAISTTTVNYVGAFAFNDIYKPEQKFVLSQVGTNTMPVWYVNYPKTFISANLDKFLAGEWVNVDEFDNISVSVSRNNSLGVDYGEGRCVKILTPDDQVNYNLSDEFRVVAGFSNPDLVIPDGFKVPVKYIFGSEPRASWCYFYQKAELARQGNAWSEIIALKVEANKAGFEPLNAYELFPFIEAYAMRAEWATAQKLSFQSFKALPKSLDGICRIWRRVGKIGVSGFKPAFQQLNGQLYCR